MKRFVILVGVALILIAGAILVQYSMRPVTIKTERAVPSAKTTALVKSFIPSRAGSATSIQWVALTLRDGSEVDATVLPGCTVRPGDAVRVYVFSSYGLSQQVYVVVGPQDTT